MKDVLKKEHSVIAEEVITTAISVFIQNQTVLCMDRMSFMKTVK